MKRIPKPKALWYQINPPKKKNNLRKWDSIAARKWLQDKFCAYKMCFRKAVDPHHSRGKAGKLANDQRYWLPLCRRHHDWVHLNMNKAREMGLLCARGDWGRQD